MIRVGVLGTASIAERRMIPAMQKADMFQYVCVATSTREELGGQYSDEEYASIARRKTEKGQAFVEKFGGDFVIGYTNLLERTDIDAVYIPLPPALHARWAICALEHGKHVILEKPFTTNYEDTASVVRLAQEKNLAVFENYGFCYHNQMTLIKETLNKGTIGDLRLIRASFGFPRRQSDDFRYVNALGGGALLDCGGYALKAATELLGKDVRVKGVVLLNTPEFDVDIYGHAMLCNRTGACAQVSFGMDNSYKCELEIWGSTGYISAPRIFTAPDGFQAPVIVRSENSTEELHAVDDQFEKVLLGLHQCVCDKDSRSNAYEDILLQSKLVDACKVRH